MSNQPMNVGELYALPDGSWIDEVRGVVGTVCEITPPSGKKPMKAKLADLTNPSIQVTAILWARPAVYVNGRFHFTGKSISMKAYKGTPELHVGEKASMLDLGVVPGSPAPQAAPPAPAPAPVSPAPAAPPAAQQPPPPPSDPARIFHQTMRRMGLMRLHCIDYAKATIVKAENAGLIAFEGVNAKTEAILTMSSSFFIDAMRGNAAMIAPKYGEPVPPPPAPAPVAPPPPPVQPPPPAKPAPGPDGSAYNPSKMPDEDVPF